MGLDEDKTSKTKFYKHQPKKLSRFELSKKEEKEKKKKIIKFQKIKYFQNFWIFFQNLEKQKFASKFASKICK